VVLVVTMSRSFCDWSAMHEICSDEPGKGERALDNSAGMVGEAQQQKGEQRDRDLNSNGIFGGSEEVADLQRLLDLSKEQFDSPSAPVKIGNVLGAGFEIVGEDAQHKGAASAAA
jgi:hypothetical protein